MQDQGKSLTPPRVFNHRNLLLSATGFPLIVRGLHPCAIICPEESPASSPQHTLAFDLPETAVQELQIDFLPFPLLRMEAV